MELKFGASIDVNNVVEGSDVYFDCEIEANPPVYKVEWSKDVSGCRLGRAECVVWCRGRG